MKRILALIFLSAACTALWASGQHSNRRAPGFSLMDTNFDQHDLQDYTGKVVVVDFMLTTCPVCNAVADTLVELKSRYGAKIEVLSIVSQPDTFDSAKQFLSKHNAHWPVLFDSGQVMLSYLQMKPTGNMTVHFPHLFLVDKLGVIRNDFDGTEGEAMTVGGLSRELDKLVK